MKRILMLILCLTLLDCMWGCQNKEEEVGCTKYELVSISVDNVTMSAKEAREASGIDDLYIKFYEDGTAKMRVGKEVINMGYDEGYVWRTDSPNDKVAYTLEQDVVTLIDGGFVYTFKK